MDEISDRLMGSFLFSDKRLLWSGQTVLSGDALSMARDSTAHVTSVWPIYMFLNSNTGSRKYYSWKKMIGWKIDLFFITENFLGILERLCVEPMCRSHDFLGLTLAIVMSSGLSGWIRRDLMYFTIIFVR